VFQPWRRHYRHVTFAAIDLGPCPPGKSDRT
jgi:hypothetical protein